MNTKTPVIMVVEDETLLLQAITKKLKLSNLDVISCASGQQAVDYLTNLDELPDAVWLDYYLKDMNGLAFMQQLKANPKWSNIPVLVVSNSASPDKVNNMLALGAKKYILKAEYRLDQIIDMIHEFIGDKTEIPANPMSDSNVSTTSSPVSHSSLSPDPSSAPVTQPISTTAVTASSTSTITPPTQPAPAQETPAPTNITPTNGELPTQS